MDVMMQLDRVSMRRAHLVTLFILEMVKKSRL